MPKNCGLVPVAKVAPVGEGRCEADVRPNSRLRPALIQNLAFSILGAPLCLGASVANNSKKPTDTHHAVHVVQSKVWLVDAGAGYVKITGFNAQRDVIPDEPANAGGGLQVKLEVMRQVRRADAGGRHPGSGINVGYPTGAGGKIIS